MFTWTKKRDGAGPATSQSSQPKPAEPQPAPAASSADPQQLAFADARPGMAVSMTPSGSWSAGKYTATVLHKDRDRVRVRWEAAAGFADPEQWIVRRWWDGPAEPVRVQREESVSPPRREGGESGEAPDHFLCPITMEVMVDPVTAWQGVSYERSAILEWLRKQPHCPCSRRPLRPEDLSRDCDLAAEISQWMHRRAAAEHEHHMDRWRQGPQGAWRRADPSDPDGKAYTRAEFVAYYGPRLGERRWEEAGRKLQPRKECWEARRAAVLRAHMRRAAHHSRDGPRPLWRAEEGAGDVVQQLHAALRQRDAAADAGASDDDLPELLPAPARPPQHASFAAAAAAGSRSGPSPPRRRRQWWFSSALWEACQSGRGLAHVQFLEKEFTQLSAQAAGDSAATRMLPPMVLEKRRVAHEYALHWQIVCRSLDREPRRSCFLTRTTATRAPPVRLSDWAVSASRPADLARSKLQETPEAALVFPGVPDTAASSRLPDLEYGYEYAVAHMLERWAGRMLVLALPRRRCQDGFARPLAAVFQTAEAAADAERHLASVARRSRVAGLHDVVRFTEWDGSGRSARVPRRDGSLPRSPGRAGSLPRARDSSVGRSSARDERTSTPPRSERGSVQGDAAAAAARCTEADDLALARRLQQEEREAAGLRPRGAGWEAAGAKRKAKAKRKQQQQQQTRDRGSASANTFTVLSDEQDD
eukprot:TRINITY_DN875_c0_g1_i1.p1 TRINITY_DN875_c0_g1~~TRINITY_DN875_c0_g1_i1.p1  ORF type:complete len:703 (+),score=219.68 TRINITY_DN875_c0_g1_i1:71-2179(+)